MDKTTMSGDTRCTSTARLSLQLSSIERENSESESTDSFVGGERGLQVFRRVQAPPRHLDPQPTSTARRSVIGVDLLDTLIGGGMFDGSTTMVVVSPVRERQF